MTEPQTTPQETNDDDIARSIQQWSWRRGSRKKLPSGYPDFGTVAMAARHFKIEAAYILTLIYKCNSSDCNPYFFWDGPDDDFSKMRFDHDGD